jgi:hypothetical protein
MWFKLDDGFATHPKLIMAGPLALALQVRAICYASQHSTDGLILLEIVPHLTVGLPEQDWPALMLKHTLWDLDDRGYRVHDFLDWNVSKAEREQWQNTLSQAGKKGAKRRWGKGRKADSLPHSQGNSPPNGQAIASLSTSISTLNHPNSSGPKSKKRSTKRSILETDSPKEKHFELGRSLGVEVGPEWGKFKNYCLAHDAQYADFDAAFRNWIANAPSMKGGSRGVH